MSLCGGNPSFGFINSIRSSHSSQKTATQLPCPSTNFAVTLFSDLSRSHEGHLKWNTTSLTVCLRWSCWSDCPTNQRSCCPFLLVWCWPQPLQVQEYQWGVHPNFEWKMIPYFLCLIYISSPSMILRFSTLNQPVSGSILMNAMPWFHLLMGM